MGRSPCCEKTHTNKGAWSKEEDDRLIAYIRAHGEGCWRSLPKSAGLQRCGKSCRLRWINYLRPDLKRGNFTEDEDELIIKLHTFLGNKWALIAARLPGRTDNEIKNYWNTHIKRKLMDQGIDPQTHRRIFSEKTNIVKNCTSQSLNSLVQTLEPMAKMSDSALDDVNCNSSTTVETQTMVMERDMSSELLDLELSIGLGPFRSRLPKSSFNSVDLQPRADHSKFYINYDNNGNNSNSNSNMLYRSNNNCGTFSFV